MIEIRVPEFGESVQEVQIAAWLRREGDSVERDDDLATMETDKATMELAAPASGVVAKILKPVGQTAKIGEVIALIDGVRSASEDEKPTRPATELSADFSADRRAGDPNTHTPSRPAADDRMPVADEPNRDSDSPVHATPSARRELRRHGLQASQVAAGATRVDRDDVLRFVAQQRSPVPQQPTHTSHRVERDPTSQEKYHHAETSNGPSPREGVQDADVDIVPMSLIRRKIADRLVAAQQRMALLTTFNEIDMSAVIELRRRVSESFQQQYQVKLGYMSFFVRATVEALRAYPVINAEIRGEEIIYHRRFHIGIAIGSERGLVVPILRNADRLSFSQIETAIVDYAQRAASGKLLPDELQSGTFTISNGGVYGSLLSTPIVNPPQSGILGMHAIEDRAVVRQGSIVIRPMMYAALTYDHRLIDGREAVSFLKRVKEVIEDPSRMLLQV